MIREVRGHLEEWKKRWNSYKSGKKKKTANRMQMQLYYLSFSLFSPSVVDPGSLLSVGSDLSLAKLRTGVSVRSAELIVHLLEVNSQSFFKKKKKSS